VATVTNIHPNPRAATNAAGSEAGPNASGAPTAVADPAFPLGTAFSETSTPANGNSGTGIYVAGLNAGNFITVAAGDLCVFRLKAKIHAGAGTPTLRVHVLFADSAGVNIGGTYFIDLRENCAIGTVYELLGLSKAPAGAARLSILITQLGSTGSTTVRVSEVMVYRNPPPGVGLAPYGDTTSVYAPPGRPDPSSLLVGFNDNAPNRLVHNLDIPQWVALLRELGATCIRFGGSSDTAAMENLSPAPGVYNFTYWEPWLNAAIAAGIQPILVTPGATAWMRSAPGFLPDAAHMSAYGDFIAAYAARFPEAAAMEVWNEPNLFWAGATGTTIDVPGYVAMCQAVYPKVKAAVPNMPVLAGVTACVGTNAGANEITADAFWSTFYAAGGKAYCDGLALHPYHQRQQPTVATTANSATASTRSISFTDHVRSARHYRDLNGDTGKPLWLTEGGSSCGTGFLSEADHATYNRLYVEMAAHRGRNPDIRMVGFNQMVHLTADASYTDGLGQIDPATFRRRATAAEVSAACGGARGARRRRYGAPTTLRRPVRR
jgi:hypothetical protein